LVDTAFINRRELQKFAGITGPMPKGLSSIRIEGAAILSYE
jgi:hypothetical protein